MKAGSVVFAAVVTLLFPFVLLFVILERVWDELKPIPFFVRCDVAENVAAWKHMIAQVRAGKPYDEICGSDR